MFTEELSRLATKNGVRFSNNRSTDKKYIDLANSDISFNPTIPITIFILYHYNNQLYEEILVATRVANTVKDKLSISSIIFLPATFKH